MGLHRAGFEMTGVDIKPQPRYPFRFVQADALEYVSRHGHEFDLIIAGPPCQVYSVLSHLSNGTHLDLVAPVREALQATGKPYIIENVPGAPLINPIRLCGTMFGLKTLCGASLRRHRLFESWPMLWFPPGQCQHSKWTIGIYGEKARDTAAEKRYYTKPKSIRGPTPQDILFTLSDARKAMGIPWMTFKELSQAIPPAYTEWLGKQMLKLI